MSFQRTIFRIFPTVTVGTPKTKGTGTITTPILLSDGNFHRNMNQYQLLIMVWTMDRFSLFVLYWKTLNFRKVLVSTFAPQRKNIVIMIDHGNSLSDNQLYTAKAVAKHILLSLGDNDRVSSLTRKTNYIWYCGL